MKYIFEVSITILILIFCSFQPRAEKVSKEKAQHIAKNWWNSKMNINQTNEISIESFIHNNDTSFHIINFKDAGFVIVSADDNTYPIIGFSDIGNIHLEKLPVEFLSWLEYYSEMILNNAKQKKHEKIAEKWNEIYFGLNLKSLQTSVPSLFESTGSSCWAGWYPYFNQAPPSSSYYQGTGGCVPGSMAELMKYHRHPRIGSGSHKYSYYGTTISENFNKIFIYEEMPYRLTYCGNGHPTCNDGSFDIIPGTTQNNIDEVGWLQYLAGVSVEMMWIDNRGDPEIVPTGTFGNTGEWVEKMVSHFYYSPDYEYWSSSSIQQDTDGFKTKARENLNNGLPVLFRYVTENGGHAVIIDGYEDDDFFHFIFGWGGHLNGYYFLFDSDDDGIHDPRPYIDEWGLQATFDITPSCPEVNDISFSSETINISESRLFEAKENITLSNIIIEGNGIDGGNAVARANNSVTITSNFEVQNGAQFIIFIEPCGIP